MFWSAQLQLTFISDALCVLCLLCRYSAFTLYFGVCFGMQLIFRPFSTVFNNLLETGSLFLLLITSIIGTALRSFPCWLLRSA
jgi:hypothetical protein